MSNLQDIADSSGCCLNEVYNSSSRRDESYNWLTYDFWSRCNLQTLGTCEVRQNEDELFTTCAVTLATTTSNAVPFTAMSTTTDHAATLAGNLTVTVMLFMILTFF